MKSHINVSIDGALAALERGENIWDVPVETIRAELQAAKAAGRTFYAGSDCDNFDDRLRSMKPRVTARVPNTLTGEGELSVDLTFESMEDFSPASIA